MLPGRRGLAALAAAAIAALAAPGLGRRPLAPAEAERVVAARGVVGLTARAGVRAGLGAESAARAPALGLAVATAAVLVLAAGEAAPAMAVLGPLSPTLLALAREASPGALAALLGAVAVLLDARGRRRPALLALGVAVAVSLGGRPLAQARALAAFHGAWSLGLGQSLPPWRLDVAWPALAGLVALTVLGAGGGPVRRALTPVVLLLAAALLGLLRPRPLEGIPGAALAPVVLFLVARGYTRLTRGWRRGGAAGLALTAGLVGCADLHLGRDVLDAAARVEWDETARMLAVLSVGDAAVIAVPDLPASLPLYAPGPIPLRPAADASPLPARVLVVGHGLRGGLAWPSARLEQQLEELGFALRGELVGGQLEPGLARLVERLTGAPAPPAYLRVRRYERR